MTSTDTTPAATLTRDGARGTDETEAVTTDQATGRELARYPVAGPEEATAATRAARAAAGPGGTLGSRAARGGCAHGGRRS
jgi:succinate-semialdehyde dehydrogenase / glutarate-semialdehyde dehydrogenase